MKETEKIHRDSGYQTVRIRQRQTERKTENHLVRERGAPRMTCKERARQGETESYRRRE